ncbi:long-chain-acyl-CoA synthetase [Calidifontibacter sp. DB0510]|uniref:Long-chain-acyl-CoA synthetase n=1 Tax=Metallococcus carri TaxID=1656884 RepID=A0A967B107_9MICO|nr:long-chain-acyl-CoA synthetase [Metallococcus carri]NHN56318.1 long-chain-acyl-CoA synthetase [Metallococcus carri]NOP38630.1 long-chain-acyl-CoA synthetase [Calidifontibacter sp. DB2511S]
MSTDTRRKVSALDLGKSMLGMAPDLPGILKGAPGLLLRKPSDKTSAGLTFQKAAAAHPHRHFLKGEGGRVLTYGESNDLVNRYASVFTARGVRRGDVVALMARNDIENILVMLAAAKIGAVAGLLNYNQRGDVLAHSLGILQAKLLVLDAPLREDLDSAGEIATRQQVITFEELRKEAESADNRNPTITSEIQGKETFLYIFTSGTTGMPKASVMSHYRWMKSYSGLGALGVRLKGDDTLYCPLPLYHNNSVTVGLTSVLNGGAAMAVAPKFSASKFWEDCIAYDATAFVYIGELCRYLLAQPERPVDKQHKVRVVVGNGLRPDIWHEFQERFGIKRIAEFYGASECNIAFINAYNIDQTAGTCPLPYKVVEYDPETGDAVRDAQGRLKKVKKGEVGLLLSKVTDRQPFDGYTDSDATEKKLIRGAFKDGDAWFNTGDLVRDQGFQHVAFVDRLGDTFRWKGENVATTEVEALLAHQPQIEDCTVYGVSVPGADGKAGMAAVVLREGASIEGPELAKHVAERLPSYAYPLFVRVVDSLEHTSTFKSRKVELRDSGFGDKAGGQVYVLTDAERGYVPYYDGYVDDVNAGRYPKL